MFVLRRENDGYYESRLNIQDGIPVALSLDKGFYYFYYFCLLFLEYSRYPELRGAGATVPFTNTVDATMEKNLLRARGWEQMFLTVTRRIAAVYNGMEIDHP